VALLFVDANRRRIENIDPFKMKLNQIFFIHLFFFVVITLIFEAPRINFQRVRGIVYRVKKIQELVVYRFRMIIQSKLIISLIRMDRL